MTADIDPRVTCTTCRKLAGGRCTDAIRAGLSRAFGRIEVGPQLAALKQRCLAYVARPHQAPSQPTGARA